MPKFIVKDSQGEEFDFDPIQNAVAQDPSLAKARIKQFDPKTGVITAETDDEVLELNVRENAAKYGMSIVKMDGDFNAPEQALDSSPLSMKDRAKLGLLSRESAELSRLVGAIGQLDGVKELDAKAEASQQRALGALKKQFQDARIVNGEYVVKKDGVWHKADAPGLDMGDIAQFAGANGLNILGSIAGGRAGPAGSIIGSALGEAAEEAVATGIAGGTIDTKAAAYDLVTDGVMNLVGTAGGKQLAKVAGKVANSAPARMIQETVENNINGFKNLAQLADGKVKDIVSKLYGNLGPDISEPVMREVIDSPANVDIAKNISKVATTDTGRANVLETITTTFQDSLEKVKKTNQAKFGKVIEAISSKADDRIELDLDATAKELEAIIKTASPENRGFLNPILTTVKETAEKIKPKKAGSTLLDEAGNVISTGEGKAVLKGKQAVAMMQQLKGKASERLNKLGVNRKTRLDNLTDMATLDAAYNMEDLLDDKLVTAAKTLELDDALAGARDLYGTTKDYMKTFWTKSFSETNDIDNVQKIIKGKMSAATETALTRLNDLHPEAGVKAALKKARVMQGGLEMQPMFSAPKSQVATGLVGGTVVGAAMGSPQALLLALPAVSPRASYLLARSFTSSGLPARSVGAASGMAKQQAEVAAKQLTRMAASAGFLGTLGRAEAYRLLQSPAEFEQLIQKMNGLIESAPNDTEAAVLDVATKRAQEKMQGGQK